MRMSREPRGPNEKLGTVLALAGISNAGLARRVNDLGAQRGLTLRYDKTSVARWVSKGMVPQGAAPHLIAAAIGSKLGRPVPLHEIGLADADPAPEVGLAFPRDIGQAVRSATELYRLDLAGRRGGVGIWQSLAGSFAVSAYATPASRWLISPADTSVARGPEDAENAEDAAAGAGTSGTGGSGADALPQRVGHSDVTKLREAAEDARRWDSKYGGGDWRSSMVPECLRVDAAPLLLGSYSDEVGRSLFVRHRRTDPARRLDGLRHRPAGGRPALLHPGAAPRPRRRRRPARRLRTGVDEPPGHLPRLRRRGRRPRPGRPGAQPRPGHRPHHELLPAGRGARSGQVRGRPGLRGGAEVRRGLAGAVPDGRPGSVLARLLQP
ncbi:sporulation protein [Streptomyces himastatinicus ATCC 53653]|uniref:Sporulation protein n=1 Tax=Streptomyces himastatinicus ATCC 53653 TaxID=457427 RepID=D9WUB5_9ACTN|nr:sporulation protein [Streptomyces himastatinicus ATCC 53653]